jgi:hypothetical protein
MRLLRALARLVERMAKHDDERLRLAFMMKGDGIPYGYTDGTTRVEGHTRWQNGLGYTETRTERKQI